MHAVQIPTGAYGFADKVSAVLGYEIYMTKSRKG